MSSSVRTYRQNFLSSARVLEPASTTYCECTATRAAEIYDDVGQRSLGRLLTGFTEDSMVQATLRASQSGIGYKRAQDNSSQAAHPSNDTRRSHGWPSAETPLETRPAAVIETATSTPSMTMTEPRQRYIFRKRLRQQKKRGSKQSGASGA